MFTYDFGVENKFIIHKNTTCRNIDIGEVVVAEIYDRLSEDYKYLALSVFDFTAYYEYVFESVTSPGLEDLPAGLIYFEVDASYEIRLYIEPSYTITPNPANLVYFGNFKVR